MTRRPRLFSRGRQLIGADAPRHDELPILHGCCRRKAAAYTPGMEDQVLAARALNGRDQRGRGAICPPVKRSRRGHVALIILAATLPILVSGGAFFVDGPNHLFRVTLWETMLADDMVAQFFQAGDRLYPNLAIDVFTSLLGKAVSPPVALTLFICAAVSHLRPGRDLVPAGAGGMHGPSHPSRRP